MKPGDILTDKQGRKWVLYETLGSFLCVTDVETQRMSEALLIEDVAEVEIKPENVAYLFMARRDKELKDLGLEELCK